MRLECCDVGFRKGRSGRAEGGGEVVSEGVRRGWGNCDGECWVRSW